MVAETQGGRQGCCVGDPGEGQWGPANWAQGKPPLLPREGQVNQATRYKWPGREQSPGCRLPSPPGGAEAPGRRGADPWAWPWAESTAASSPGSDTSYSAAPCAPAGRHHLPAGPEKRRCPLTLGTLPRKAPHLSWSSWVKSSLFPNRAHTEPRLRRSCCWARRPGPQEELAWPLARTRSPQTLQRDSRWGLEANVPSWRCRSHSSCQCCHLSSSSVRVCVFPGCGRDEDGAVTMPAPHAPCMNPSPRPGWLHIRWEWAWSSSGPPGLGTCLQRWGCCRLPWRASVAPRPAGPAAPRWSPGGTARIQHPGGGSAASAPSPLWLPRPGEAWWLLPQR